MNFVRICAVLMALLTVGWTPAAAQSKTSVKPPVRTVKKSVKAAVKMVAYDAKDKRYYSVAWAKAHGMRDKGGDKLIIIPIAQLPKDAKISRAMHGNIN